MDAWGQPPRRSTALPLVLIATGLFGIAAAFALGLFFGYQVGVSRAGYQRPESKKLDEVSRKRLASKFTCTPSAKAGWYDCRFGDMRVSLTLPGKPEIGEYTPEESDLYRYSSVRSFAFYDIYGVKADVYLCRYFYYREYLGGCREVISETLQGYRDPVEYRQTTISLVRERTVSGMKGYEGSATYDWHGGRYKTLTFVTQELKASFQVTVTAEPKAADETYAKVLSTLKFTSE